jgi:DNA-damage-inducible protein D
MADLEKHDPFGFEYATADGECKWHSEWLREALGYADKRSFRAVVERAMKACILAHIDISSEFTRNTDGTYILTRVACFMIAMNSDSKKPQVASIQAHLARIANATATYFDQATSIARVLVRDEVSDGLKSLAATAKEHGVVEFGKFMNAGYRGMYNMSLEQLKSHKRVPAGEELLDRMNPPELAANLFRITQTDEKMKVEFDMGQESAEKTAHDVGTVVRETMMKISGTKPEDLEIAAKNIRDVKKGLRRADRNLRLYDKKSKIKRLFDTLPDVSPKAPDEGRTGYTADPDDDKPDDN